MAKKNKSQPAVKSDASLSDLLKQFQTQAPDPVSEDDPAYDDSGYSTHPQSNRNMGAALDALKGHDSSAEDDMNPPESLGSIQARLKALADAPGGPDPESVPPPNEIDKISDLNRITPTDLAPQAAPTAPTPAPFQPLPDPTSSSPSDDIAQLLAQRQGYRDQQQNMRASGDPLSRLLVGLGGSFADGAGSGKGARTDYAGSALKEYQAPLDEQMKIKMKALDGSIADTNPLIQLAQARAKSGMDLKNQKDMADYKHKLNPPRTFEQQKELAALKKSNGLVTTADGTQYDPKETKTRSQLIKDATKVINSHLMSPSTNLGKNQQRLDTADRLQTLAFTKDGKIRNLDQRESVELAIGLATLLAPGQPGVTQIDELVPHSFRGDWDKRIEWWRSKPQGLEQQRFTRRVADTIARERATAEQQLVAGKNSALASLPIIKQLYPKDYEALVKANVTPHYRIDQKSGGGAPKGLPPVPPGKVRYHDPNSGLTKDYDQSLEQQLIDNDFVKVQ